MPKFELLRLLDPKADPGGDIIMAAMVYRADGRVHGASRNVRTISPEWATFKTACLVTGLDPLYVCGPIVTDLPGGILRAQVTFDGRDYAAEGSEGRSWVVVQAIFAAANGADGFPAFAAAEAVVKAAGDNLAFDQKIVAHGTRDDGAPVTFHFAPGVLKAVVSER